MVKKDRIREILEVLDSYPKIPYNKLKKILVEEKKKMAAQTFANALKEGVESRIITREEDHYKKRKIVWYSKPENVKRENDYYQELINDVNSFSHKLEILKEQFSKLNNIEKGQILFSFSDWLQVIGSRIGMGSGYFGSSKITELYGTKILPLSLEIVKLSLSVDLKQQSAIMNEYFLGWNDIKQDCSEEIDYIIKNANSRKTK